MFILGMRSKYIMMVFSLTPRKNAAEEPILHTFDG